MSQPNSQPKLPTWVIVVVTLIYIVSPIDLIPFCPIDDAIVGVAAAGMTISNLLKR